MAYEQLNLYDDAAVFGNDQAIEQDSDLGLRRTNMMLISRAEQCQYG